MPDYLLINSPIFESPTTKERSLPPMGQAYIATALNNSGFETLMLDCVRDGIGIDGVIAVIEKNKPAFIGLNIFSQNSELVKRIVESIQIDCTVFIGGLAAFYLFDEITLWNTNNRLIVIAGEGEKIIPAICKKDVTETPCKSIGNKYLYCVDETSIYYPGNLDEIDLDVSMLSSYNIENHFGDKEANIISSRGCIYNCAFCGGARSVNRFSSPRFRSKQSLEKEIQRILELDFEVRSIRVLDDLFLRTEMFEEAILLFESFDSLMWRGMAHIIPILKNNDKIDDLYKSGCKELFIGIESGSEVIRRKINKIGSVEQVFDAVKMILNAGINVKGYFMMGFPEETEEDLNQTLGLAKELKRLSGSTKGSFRSSSFQFRPYHGTKLYKTILEKRGTIGCIQENKELSALIGRQQFNFSSGNYSDVSDEVLNRYLLELQML